MPSFTTKVPNLKEAGPIVDVGITVGAVVEELLKKTSQPIPPPIKTVAMIDTGATGTVIREDLVQRLNLNPVGVVMINTPSCTNLACYEYAVRIIFPGNVVADIVAIAAPLQGQHIQCLVGRDILGKGVFIYTGYVDTFTLSF